jgi:hypothetical protein
MFSSDSQKAAVCKVLVGMVGRGDLFTDEGPTDEAISLFGEEGASLAEGDERTICLTALALWNGDGGPTIGDLRKLAPANLVAVGSLMRCIPEGPDQIDNWLKAAPVQE